MALANGLRLRLRGLLAFARELSFLRSLVRLPKIDMAARINSVSSMSLTVR